MSSGYYQQPPPKKKRHPFRKLFLLGLSVVLLAVGAFYGYRYYEVRTAELPPLNTTASTIFATDGKTVLAKVASENSRKNDLPDKKVPNLLRQAFMGAEDRNFYNEAGVNPWKIALRIGLSKGEAGGSGITEQYAKNAYNLTVLPTVQRKPKEWIYASLIERDHPGRTGKDEIIDLYMNSIFFGAAYGVDNASWAYFGHSAADINDPDNPKDVSEAAILAGIVKDPCHYGEGSDCKSSYTKEERRQDLKNRRAYVIDGMNQVKDPKPRIDAYKHEIGPLDSNVASQAKNLAINFKAIGKTHPPDTDVSDPFLRDSVRKSLADYETKLVKEEDSGLDDKAASAQGQSRAASLLAHGGLTITTTIDAGIQKNLSNAISDHTPLKGLEAGAVIEDPRSGAILALYGGSNYGKSQYNKATDAFRQLGSTMKVPLLAQAVRSGISPESTLPDPEVVNVDGQPARDDYKQPDPNLRLTWVQALARSSNTWHMQMMTGKMADGSGGVTSIPGWPSANGDMGISPKNVLDLANRLGLSDTLYRVSTPKQDVIPRIALGTNTATPLGLASLGSTLADGGKHKDPYLINQIKFADGAQDYQYKGGGSRSVLSRDQAAIVNQVATHVITEGTARNSAQVPGRQTAGKTGTTDTDGRMIQWTPVDQKNDKAPAYVCSIWMGFEDNRDTNGDLFGADTSRVCQIVLDKALNGRKAPYSKFATADLNAGKHLPEGAPPPPSVEPSTAPPPSDEPSPSLEPTPSPSDTPSSTPPTSRPTRHPSPSRSTPSPSPSSSSPEIKSTPEE